MERNDIVARVSEFEKLYGLTIDEMVVGYEAASVMHGVRDTATDLDVDVHLDDFQKMCQHDYQNRGIAINGEFITLGGIDLHVGEHNEDYELIDGIWVVGVKTLLRQFRTMFYHPDRSEYRRKKDLYVIRSLTRNQ